MMARIKLTGLMITALVLSASFVYAQGNGGNLSGKHAACGTQDKKHKEHHGDKHRMMAKVLNLTADQKKQIKESNQKQWDIMKSAYKEIKSNRAEFNGEIVKDSPDMNKITAIQNQLKALSSQMADNHLNAILEIKKVLTPEQFIRYMALEKEEDLKSHEHGKMCAMCEGHKEGRGHKHGKKDAHHDTEHSHE